MKIFGKMQGWVQAQPQDREARRYCSRDSMLPSVMTSATVACNKFNVLDKFNLVRQSLTKTTTKKRQLVSFGREKEGTRVF